MILRGGTVVDGSGGPARVADIEIANGVVVAVGDLSESRDRDVREVSGLVVSPGFVDIHSHSDFSVLGHPHATSAVLQGITTLVVGNCGLAVTPVDDADTAARLRPYMTYCDDRSVDWDWTSVAEYRERLRHASPAVEVGVLAGHNTLRGSVVGLEDRPATGEELERMCAMLDAALADGALGMSLGLMYPPSAYADEDELVALGRVLRAHDAVLASHMANYSAGLHDSVASMIRVGERSGVRVQISHLTVTGREHWGAVSGALSMIDDAVARGVDVAADFYPYLAGSTNLSQTLPGWAVSGGWDALRKRMGDEAQRRRMREHLISTVWEDFLLVSTGLFPELDGLRMTEAAARVDREPADLALHLLAVCDPTIVAFGRSELDLLAVMRHPLTVLGSDGLAVDTFGVVGGPVPHPRFFGAFPALFQKYVRENPVLTLEEAVRKCTSAPAERVRLRDRGLLRPGLRGDVVVFDPLTIADRSTYEDSRRVPDGIVTVIRGGVEVARGGSVVAGARP